MTHLRTKLLVAAAVLVLAVGYLAYAGLKAGRSYYLPVDAFLADPQYHSRHVRLHGKVAEEGLDVNSQALSASFQLLGEKQHLPVSYHGVLPDTFKAGCEVVVEGQLQPGGVFRADQVLTKCASKYQSQSAAKGDRTGRSS